MWCGPETTKDKRSCGSLNAFEEVGVSSRTVIINNQGWAKHMHHNHGQNTYTMIKDGQNICTIKYKK